MTYTPGDNWCICDLSGKKVLMSQTKKTWDGLRVWAPLWYPRNPQDFLKGLPDRMNVVDGRPRPADEAYPWQPPMGSFCLQSPSGIFWTYYVDDDGALLPLQMKWGNAPFEAELVPGFMFSVDDDGALHVRAYAVRRDPAWRMVSPSGLIFGMTVDVDLAVHLTLESGPAFMEGVFTLISPNGTHYVIYIEDNKAVRVRPGSWGPVSLNFYLDIWEMHVNNVGALQVRASGEKHPTQYRMVSTGGYEYMWRVDSHGAVRIGREGHWWDVPVIVNAKPTTATEYPDSIYDATDQVAEDGQHSWVSE